MSNPNPVRLEQFTSEAYKTLVSEGAIRESVANVDISGREVPYVKALAATESGAKFLAGGLMDATVDDKGELERSGSVCGFFNYGFDLTVRAKVRQLDKKISEGPEKAARKTLADLVAAGMPREQAVATVQSLPAFKGLDINLA